MNVEKPYRPSNGTEGEMFHARWCDHCAHLGDPDEGSACDILGRTMVYQIEDPSYPPEWVSGEGWPAKGATAPRCTAYKAQRQRLHLGVEAVRALRAAMSPPHGRFNRVVVDVTEEHAHWYATDGQMLLRVTTAGGDRVKPGVYYVPGKEVVQGDFWQRGQLALLSNESPGPEPRAALRLFNVADLVAHLPAMQGMLTLALEQHRSVTPLGITPKMLSRVAALLARVNGRVRVCTVAMAHGPALYAWGERFELIAMGAEGDLGAICGEDGRSVSEGD